jgi:hypothetical protein
MFLLSKAEKDNIVCFWASTVFVMSEQYNLKQGEVVLHLMKWKIF